MSSATLTYVLAAHAEEPTDTGALTPVLTSEAPEVMREPVKLTTITNKKEASVSFEDTLMKINVKYPTGIQKDADATIKTFVENALANFQKQVPAKPLSENWKYEMYMTYRTRNLGAYSSVEMTTYEFTGGAHGMTTLQTYNFEKKTGKKLTLTDIFPQKNALSQISKIAERSFTKMLKQKKLGSDVEWIKSGTKNTPENYANYVITAVKGTGKKATFTVKFFFPQYQVASYADGIKTLMINSTNLK